MTLQDPVATRETTTSSGWRAAPTPSPQAAARTYATTVQVGDTWWTIAGNNNPPNDLSSTDCLTWTEASRGAVSHPRNAGATINNTLFTSGGIGIGPPPQQAVNQTFARNPAVAGGWTLVRTAPPWRGRREHMMAGFDGKLWVIGGADAAYQWFAEAWWTTPDFVDGWQPDTSWTGPARGDSAVAVYNNELWIIAGQSNGAAGLADAVSKAPGQAWRTRTLPPGFTARNCAQAQVVGDKLYVFGGRGGTAGGLLDMWCYDGAVWTQLGDTCPWGHDLFGYASTVKDGEIYVTGGNIGAGRAGGNQTIYIYTPA
jgi:N-acetylneuraminic acid mutarotase